MGARGPTGPTGPLIRVATPQPRVLELEGDGDFAHVMEEAETARRAWGRRCDPRQKVVVMLQVSDDDLRWFDWEEFWSGYWRPAVEGGVPQPTEGDMLEAARQAGKQYARAVTRSAV